MNPDNCPEVIAVRQVDEATRTPMELVEFEALYHNFCLRTNLLLEKFQLTFELMKEAKEATVDYHGELINLEFEDSPESGERVNIRAFSPGTHSVPLKNIAIGTEYLSVSQRLQAEAGSRDIMRDRLLERLVDEVFGSLGDVKENTMVEISVNERNYYFIKYKSGAVEQLGPLKKVHLEYP